MIIISDTYEMTTGNIQRQTRQRRVILEEVKSTDIHPTATEIYHIVRQRIPNISLGTVYRNLGLLVAAGEVRKLKVSGSKARFDGDLGNHHHVRCTLCGRIDDVKDLPVPLEEDRFESLTGYKMTGFRLEFVGICRTCRQSRGEVPENARPREDGE